MALFQGRQLDKQTALLPQPLLLLQSLVPLLPLTVRLPQPVLATVSTQPQPQPQVTPPLALPETRRRAQRVPHRQRQRPLLLKIASPQMTRQGWLLAQPRQVLLPFLFLMPQVA
jgi:hypothetical protein